MEIGVYDLNDNYNYSGIGIVNAVYRTILFPKKNTIFGLGCDAIIDEAGFVNKYQNPETRTKKYYTHRPDKEYCYTLLEFLSCIYRNSEKYKKDDSENSDTIFHSTTLFYEEEFLQDYEEISVVSKEKSINVGEKYIDKKGEKVFVLGIVRTHIDEDSHTVIIRENIDEKFNEYINYDHPQFGITPDYYNSWFLSRAEFLSSFKRINS